MLVMTTEPEPDRNQAPHPDLATELERLAAGGRQYRLEHPEEYADPDNPPSKKWQEELYDENGLPA